jgi:NAD(P)-dependent dehydrogenase (short-subunit alcohol dehydrogenase family)
MSVSDSDGLYPNVEPVSNSNQDQECDPETLRAHMSIPGGLIEVEEIANAAIFMASEASSGINGIALPIDAGWSMIHN